MDRNKQVKEVAREVRDALAKEDGSTTIPASKSGAWDELEKRIAQIVGRHLDEAFAAGKTEGIREAKKPS